MMKPLLKLAGRMKEPAKESITPARLEFELALEIGDPDRPLAEIVRHAAESAGGELLFVLPSPAGDGDTAVVRFAENGGSRFVQVRRNEQGYILAEDGEIATPMLGFARTSADLFERLRADERLLAPLAAAQ